MEGLDGVGKSTCAKHLAKRINGKYVATPMHPFNTIRDGVDQLNDLTTRFHYYLSAIIGASSIIEQSLTTHPVVCDRYVYSTIAYHRAMGVSVGHINLDLLPICVPTCTFLLTANDEIRAKRIQIRENRNTQWDDIFVNDHALLNCVKKEFSKFTMIEIDTAHLLVEDVVDILVQYIGVKTNKITHPISAK